MKLPLEGALRRKDFREAADAGLLLWRQNFAAFLPFFAIPFWICAFALRMLPGNWKYLSWLIIWLLKPLFDRIILHIISVRFFERGASLSRLRQGLGKSLYRGLAGDLLWRRFSPLRSAMMPVRVLEQNIKSGKGITERKKLLENGGIGYCFLLTVWGAAVEITLLAGEILFFITMTELMARGFLSSIESFADVEIFIYAAWCINYMLVETIYVCMGFSLYINSRVEVEGWDIEITFRDLAEKLKNKSKNIALIVLLLACLFMPVSTSANDVPLETLQNILESPDFGTVEDSWGIRLRNPSQPGDFPEYDFGFTEHLRRIFAYILQFILIGIIAGLIVFLFIYLRKFRQSKAAGTGSADIKTMHTHPAEDPTALLEKALSFHEQGKIRLAWGYCTAAAIQSWPHYYDINFPPNATENDCAHIVNLKTGNNPQAYAFGKLVKHWVYFAYGGRHPPEGSFEEAAALCKILGIKNG